MRSGGDMHNNMDLEQEPSNRSRERSLLKGSDENLRVLGVGWRPKEDVIVFEVVLNFSEKRRGLRTGPNLMLTDLPPLPDILTKRIVLQQVMKIYDPLGLMSPFTLIGKIYGIFEKLGPVIWEGMTNFPLIYVQSGSNSSSPYLSWKS